MLACQPSVFVEREWNRWTPAKDGVLELMLSLEHSAIIFSVQHVPS